MRPSVRTTTKTATSSASVLAAAAAFPRKFAGFLDKLEFISRVVVALRDASYSVADEVDILRTKADERSTADAGV